MDESTPKNPLLTNKLYDWLKFLAQILLPAAGTLYFTLATLYGWDNGNQVVGTIVAVDTFLGVLLGLSTQQYNKSDAKYDGTIDVTETADAKTFALNLHSDPNELDQKDSVTFKVNPQ